EGVEAIADAAARLDPRGPPSPLEPAEDSCDELVDTPRADDRPAPDLRQQRATRQHAAGIRREHVKELEFLLGQAHLSAVHAHTAPARTDVKPCHIQTTRIVPELWRRLTHRARRPRAEQRANRRDQLAKPERL